ncbi:DUF1846 domain-containing protein [Peptacetobacter hiranonis]|uniref:DUF1846 domain-containing protein n=1 Tax=Peptacetobacter hiranonis TaxID=89152 RepID=UPI0019176054|nr:DUF1846 domain-containing protein [Peptacetobacter hiranonis]MEE0248462.1 DUF1846 domain-containing protein [Peptacetobacter hiranonis]QQQ87239.1 DUF1846 domain-containing protein [Peptacetobacter hiranonis]
MKIGFDHEKYLKEQSKYILERVNNFDKLYLEFGGKLIADLHAKRVLPGFDENAKIKVLSYMKDSVEVVICVYAGDIERNKVRGDFGTTYDMEVLRLIDDLRSYDLDVNSVVITRYEGQPATTVFINKLEKRGIKVYKHAPTKGYPSDVDTIVSEEGFGANPYIETTKPIVVMTAPGPNSGKLGTCLSQLYHENKRGNEVGYSKFETFPVWNVPLKHPLNIAYEAATVDLKDVNMIDSFHLEKYGEMAVNYNRDLELFPVLKKIIEKITGKESMFQSPTDMGVNRVGFGIVNDDVVKEASIQEIIRRYFNTACDYKKGQVDKSALQRMKFIMEELDLKPEDRKVVNPAREYSSVLKEKCEDKNDMCPVMAIELEDGTILTGRGSDLMNASAALILNAIKYLGNIPDEMHLISRTILDPIVELKSQILSSKNNSLSCQEVLEALSICAVTNPSAAYALGKIPELKGCQAHSTVMMTKDDEQTLKKIGIDVTCDPEFASQNLYYI